MKCTLLYESVGTLKVFADINNYNVDESLMKQITETPINICDTANKIVMIFSSKYI